MPLGAVEAGSGSAPESSDTRHALDWVAQTLRISRTAVSVTIADTVNTVSKAATDSANAVSEPSGGMTGKITVAVAALVLPVVWGLAVHLVFNWLAKRRAATASEEPMKQDFKI